MKQLFHYHLDKGQIIFLIIAIILTLFTFLVIMLGNTTTSSFKFITLFKNFISLRSLAISGLNYVLYHINQDPNFTTTSAQVIMPQGYFIYSVTDVNPLVKKVEIQANLNSELLSKILIATVTIDYSGKILDLEVKEE